jgi:hypothetical protein
VISERIGRGIGQHGAAQPPGADALAHGVVDDLRDAEVDQPRRGSARGRRVGQARGGVGRADARPGDREHGERVD